jgi:hypothetical protein
MVREVMTMPRMAVVVTTMTMTMTVRTLMETKKWDGVQHMGAMILIPVSQ